jgi:hypothetical protein
MRLFVEVLQREVDELHANGFQLRFIGAREQLPEILRKRVADAEAKTAGNSRMTLVLAVPMVAAGTSCRRHAAWPPRSARVTSTRRTSTNRWAATCLWQVCRARPADPHRRRAACQQFPALGPGLHGDLLHRYPLAGLQCGRTGRGAGSLQSSAAALWRGARAA